MPNEREMRKKLAAVPMIATNAVKSVVVLVALLNLSAMHTPSAA